MRCLEQLWKLALTTGLAVSLAACSDDSASSSEEDDDEPGQIIEPGDDPSDPGDNPSIPGDPGQKWNVLLVPSIATDIEMAQKSSASLGVMLVSILNNEGIGNGVSDQMIRWEVTSGSEFVSLRKAQSFTDEYGIANVVVNAHSEKGEAVVVASFEGSPKSVSFKITVDDVPTGNLKAHVNYKGYAPTKNYSIRLYDRNAVDCENFEDSYVPEAEPLYKADEISTLFKDLSIEGSYTLIGYGYAENGAIVAAGCTTSNLKILPDTTIESTVVLDTIDLDMTTTYHVRSYFDLGDVTTALGDVGKWINKIGAFADNPAGMLYDILFDIVKSNVSSIAGSLVDKVLDFTGLKSKLLNYLNGLISKNSVACQTGLFICQFRDLIRLMEFMGELDVIRKNDVELIGSNAYDGLSVYWRMNCTNSNDPNCGRYPLTTKQLGIGTNVNFLEGSWQGSVANGYDKLSIEAHDLSLYYGKIIQYVFNNILIPKVTNDNAHSFNEALAYWVNADSIAEWLSDTLTFDWWVISLDVPKAKARGWVDSAINGLASLIGFGEAYLSMQKAGSEITISGTAYVVDTNGDNIVDIIRDGNWSGSMTITTTSTDDDGNSTTSAQTTAIKGIWSAYNLKNVEIDADGNIYCTNPKTETDSSDQLCSYPAIDKSKLVTSNMCAKYASCAK